MPRPGYEIEDDGAFDEVDTLAARFDPELGAEVKRLLKDGKLTEAHVNQIYRLASAAPEERDSETLAGVVEQATHMDVGQFEDWVSERIRAWRDQ